MDLTIYINSFIIIILTVFIGVFIADILFSIGFHKKLLKPLKLILKIPKLPSELSIPMVIGIIDSRAEHAIISSLVRENKLNHKEVIVYTLFSMPFSGLRLIIEYVLPISIAAFGISIGLIYIGLSFFALIISMIMGIILGRIFLKNKEIIIKEEIKNSKINLKKSLIKSIKITKDIGIKYFIVLIIVILLVYFGVFNYLENISKIIAEFFIFNAKALPITITYIINYQASLLIAGELIREGILFWKDAIIALFIGRLVYSLLFEFLHSFPFYVAIYDLKLAIKLTITIMIYTIISTPILIFILMSE
ncbi:MAG: hypothetical protein NO483_05805 [Candidatus Methanomethylicia archaeon]|nr:hypothetical protein [Candidatus Methanomethylicia archaeon]